MAHSKQAARPRARRVYIVSYSTWVTESIGLLKLSKILRMRVITMVRNRQSSLHATSITISPCKTMEGELIFQGYDIPFTPAMMVLLNSVADKWELSCKHGKAANVQFKSCDVDH